MTTMNIQIVKTKAGVYIIILNGRIVRNSHSCPPGAATYGSEEEAREWLANNRKQL
jgi:hypothetical protein